MGGYGYISVLYKNYNIPIYNESQYADIYNENQYADPNIQKEVLSAHFQC